jgi:class 3 adenylate cyclase
MDDSVGSTTDVGLEQGMPRGRCGTCGYPVHEQAGFICPECGSDLRKSGIVTVTRSRWTRLKPVLWFVAFAFPWAIACLWVASWMAGITSERLLPYRLAFRYTYRLSPLDGRYESIIFVQDVHGVVHGTRAYEEPLKDHVGEIQYDLNATLNSAKGATVLRIAPLSEMAWRRTGGAGAEMVGQAALNRAAVADWLKAGGNDSIPSSADRQADELMSVFDRLKLEVEGGHSFYDVSRELGILTAVAKWHSTPSFNGLEINRYSGPPPAPPPTYLWYLGAAIPWSVGTWWWWRRGQRRQSAAEPRASQRDATEPAPVVHRLMSVLFSDVKGYTSHSATQSRATMLDLVRRHRDVVFPAVKKHGGRVVKQMGDGILCTFDGATDAVLAGLEIQRAACTPSARLELRIGISTGEVTIEGDDVFGPAVNLASRIQQLCPPGGILFSEATLAVLNAREVSPSELGTFELKGVPQPVKVYQAAQPPA